MRAARRLVSEARGASAVEFALAVPLLLTFVLGVAQLGFLFFASADLRNATAAGARLAAVYPRPDDAEIVARIEQRIVRLDPEKVEGPSIVHGVDARGNDYADVSMSYAMPLDFILFELGPVRLSETRRVFTQPREP